MTRVAMTVGLAALALVVGLFTCVVQSDNHERARRLAEVQREWEMIEAANEQRRAVVDAHVFGRANEAAGRGDFARRGRGVRE